MVPADISLLIVWVGRGVGENPELQVARHMMEMVLRWYGYFRKGIVEAYGAQRALLAIYSMVCKDSGKGHLSRVFEEIPRGIQKAKKVRVRTYLGGPAQNHQIYIRPGHGAFAYEFGKFPQSDMMDTLDATAWAFRELRRPESEVEHKMIVQSKKRQKYKRLRMVGRSGY